MEFNDIYKKYTRDELVKKHQDNIFNYGRELNILLSECGKIKYNLDDATISIEPKKANQFLIYNGEFFAFLKNSFELLMSNEAISYKKESLNLSHPFDKEMISPSEDGDLDYSIISHRKKDYNTALYMMPHVTCVSANQVCHNEAQKMAAVFTDCVIAGEKKDDFCSYSSALEICQENTNRELAEILFNFAVKVWTDLCLQVYPYIYGLVYNDRKKKGLCPDCGGVYKGLFVKKCVKCRTPLGDKTK